MELQGDSSFGQTLSPSISQSSVSNMMHFKTYETRVLCVLLFRSRLFMITLVRAKTCKRGINIEHKQIPNIYF